MVFKGVDYAEPLQGHGRELVDNLSTYVDMNALFRAVPIRNCMILMRYFSDKDFRENVHIVISRSIRSLAVEAGPDAMLVILGHSLGTVVMTEYMKLVQSGDITQAIQEALGPEGTALLSHLELFYTIGCPFNWFYPSHCQGAPKGEWKWINFYYPSDIVVGPISLLSPEYSHVQDISVPMGWNPLKHTPASHLYYVMDRFIFDHIRNDMIQLLQRSRRGSKRSMIISAKTNTRPMHEAASVNCLLQLGHENSDRVFSPTNRRFRHARINPTQTAVQIGTGPRKIAGTLFASCKMDF